ncbi:hypothetical protein V2H45_19405 [Tumidithrix elongata RA019]|uniref:Uncharacterized protein n=1 Tax=Tumidithrix elongata BACA0141 TaxID=2716417 RepID=A0AAW9Q638_9CYAN|nr:hypothetical protein [Tumidithrix elongata RA019]
MKHKILLIALGLGGLFLCGSPAIAGNSCTEEAISDIDRQLPVVITKTDLIALSGKSVRLYGRYQPDLSMCSSSSENLSEPCPAQIVLQDGWIVPISPRGKAIRRNPDELTKYAQQPIEAIGRVSWWENSFPTSGIDIQKLRLTCGNIPLQSMAKADSSDRANNLSSVDALNQTPPIGALGVPLGTIVTISGSVSQNLQGSKSDRLDLALTVEQVNDRPLPKPIIIPFQVFMTAQISQPVLARKFRYVGYETGGFTGIPSEAFQFVPAVTSTGHVFRTNFQILQEELAVVKSKADLIRLNTQRVRLIGRYISRSSPPPEYSGSNSISGQPVPHFRASILLNDGTEVPIFSPYLKQSLRSPAEVKEFEGKTVVAVGQLQIDPDRQLNPQQSSALSLDGLWLYQPIQR